jgi:hypothetical protein
MEMSAAEAHPVRVDASLDAPLSRCLIAGVLLIAVPLRRAS